MGRVPYRGPRAPLERRAPAARLGPGLQHPGRPRYPRRRGGAAAGVKRLQSLFKDPISGLMHVVTAAAALVGVLVLVAASPPAPAARLALLVYGLSLVLMFTASSLYHLVKTSPARELWLRKLDHTAIYLLIAGTYTP